MITESIATDIVVTKSGVLSLGSILAVTVSHFFNMPTWIQVSAAIAATVASVYAIRLTRLNMKKTNAELKILRAKAHQLGVNIDD
jgi:membrane protein implicated in regulation of membrane protease activity